IDLRDRITTFPLTTPGLVVLFVAPRGAEAGSAGTLITLAGHISAMSPQTTIGAASPVGGQGEDIGETMGAKVKNILKAKVRTLAARRPAEAIALAESMIEEARAATAEEALRIGLVDIIAQDVPDLLKQLDGRTVLVQEREVTLRTTGLREVAFEMGLLENLLSLLTNPNILFLLLFIGAQALLIELSSPGIGLAGLVGVVSLALALYGLGVLPVNWFGLVFIVLAVVLFLVDLQTGIGLLSLGAVVSLAIGVLVLFNSPGSLPYFRVSVPLVVGTSVVVGGAFLALVASIMRSRRRPVEIRVPVGAIGEVRTRLDPLGIVHVAGEDWTAESLSGPIEPGQHVRIVSVEGLRLKVRTEEPHHP
ncbi:MAG: NfeD family protein, partial [Thermoflexales bacterium]